MNDPYLWIGVLAVIGWLISFCLAITRRSAVGVFALLALALTYGMVSNLVALIGTIFGERLMYIPSAFVLILIALATSRLSSRVLVPFVGLAVVLGAGRSATYAARWSDGLKFYQLALEDQPGSIRLYINLAAEYRKRGQLLDAERVDAAGRQLLPEYGDIWLQSGQIALELNKLQEARRFFNKAMEIEPGIHAAGWFPILEQKEQEQAASTTQSAE